MMTQGPSDNRRQRSKPPEDITLGEAFRRYMKSAVELAPKSVAAYELSFRRITGGSPFDRDSWFSIPESTYLDYLTDDDVSEMVSDRRGHGDSNNTILADIRVLKLILNSCRRKYLVADLEFPDVKAFAKSRYLSRGEEGKILEVLTEDHVTVTKARELFVFLIDTGARLNEALDLPWPNVDLQGREIKIYRKKTRSFSVVPMSERVYEILSKNVRRVRPFTDMGGAVKLLRRVIHKVCNTNHQRIEIEGAATIHSLRDTFATRLASGGMTLHQVASMTGHKSDTMAKKYAHLEQTPVVNQARRILNG